MKLLCMVSSPNRGTKSERNLIIRLLKNGVHPQAIFHDLYLRKKDGEYSQVDLVVATPQGLLAIEVKDYSGWIFGKENNKYWTQTLNYGKEKHSFYNPIKQNDGHIRALMEQSEQMSKIPIYNIVLFTKRSVLRNVNYTEGSIFVDYTNNIMSILKKIGRLNSAEYTNKAEIACILHASVCNGANPEIVSSHIESIKKRASQEAFPMKEKYLSFCRRKQWL